MSTSTTSPRPYERSRHSSAASEWAGAAERRAPVHSHLLAYACSLLCLQYNMSFYQQYQILWPELFVAAEMPGDRVAGYRPRTHAQQGAEQLAATEAIRPVAASAHVLSLLTVLLPGCGQ